MLTLARASTSGKRIGIATRLGIATGDLVHTILAVVGISAVILTSAVVFGLIKYVGAAYLFYLGLRAIFERTEARLPTSTTGMTFVVALRQGILIETLNAKSALFFLAFLPQFVDPERGAVGLRLMTLGVLFVLMGLFSTVIVALSARALNGFLRSNPAVLRVQAKLVGGIYCALGLRLALQER